MTALGQTSLLRSLGFVLFLTFTLPLHGQSGHGYVGAQACAKCHEDIHHKWAESLHSKMMQPATEQSVKGDFVQGPVVLHASTYALQHRKGNYYITESFLEGKPWEHQVDYILGSRRIQQYLATLPDGSIVLMPISWDIIRKKWVSNLDIQNPDESPGVQVELWNKSCFSCHVSQGTKNFDVEHLRYHSTWQNPGINCELCHGPGREHAVAAASPKPVSNDTRALIRASVVNPARLDATPSTMICAQCHSIRDIYANGFTAGANYYDFFLPAMEYRLPASEDPAYWPDGRPRWFSNEVLAFWESQCFLKGRASCASCHSDSHNINVDRDPRLRPGNNALCTLCHTSISANISAHTHHAPNSAGSFCIECHMPASVISLKARIRDHSISVPVPENTIRHAIPNACNLCHKDKNADWASRQMNAWYGHQSREKLVRRADAFTEARKGNSAAISALLQILSDESEGPLVRANAVGYLGTFPNDPLAYDAMFRSFSDREPLVRATAVMGIRPRAAQRQAAAFELIAQLKDPVTIVRMNAAVGLVALGVRQLQGEDGERFERAKELYRVRAELNSDDAQQQFAAGKFFLLSGDVEGAAAALRASMKLDSTIPAQYYLARALAEKGSSEEARQILEAIPRDDPQYASAQQFLASLELNGTGHGQTAQKDSANQDSSDAQSLFLDGQLQYRNANYGAALKQLEQALHLAPQADWAIKAQIYRTVCLEKLSRTSEAETAMQALSSNPAARDDVDLQLAYAELLYETERPEEALKRIDALIADVPRAPTAYLWRARVLLQLHQTDEAASAVEEAIRLQPELPAAHNLLLRIYQMQGRVKDAAHEAQWLRDYQRRLQSH
jgi:tetratricopeptide (TPR) repeat protein